MNNYFVLNGDNISGSSTLETTGHHSTSLQTPAIPMGHFLFHEFYAEHVILNPVKIQNLRKYFEMRKKYGIEA
jgi:hypothetical protein